MYRRLAALRRRSRRVCRLAALRRRPLRIRDVIGVRCGVQRPRRDVISVRCGAHQQPAAGQPRQEQPAHVRRQRQSSVPRQPVLAMNAISTALSIQCPVGSVDFSGLL